jgi:hypothetical protein
MAITPSTSKGQLITVHFAQLNVAASQTGVALAVAGLSGGPIGETMPFDYGLVAVAYDLSVAGTTGAFTINPTINTTAIASTYQATVGTTTKGKVIIPRGLVRGVAGDVLGVKITTAGSWDGTTGDLAVTLYVLVGLEGI